MSSLFDKLLIPQSRLSIISKWEQDSSVLVQGAHGFGMHFVKEEKAMLLKLLREHYEGEIEKLKNESKLETMNEQMTANAWVARDKDGTLWIYNYEKPQKGFSRWDTDGDCMSMLQDQLDSVKWEDEEPAQVEITIKLKRQ